MGTNYYLRHNICNECNRYEKLHIGKSSYKWKFLFYAQDGITTYKVLVEFLLAELEKGSRIFDEYGREIELEELLSLVAGKQCDKGHEFDDTNYLDTRGYNFSTREFS